MSAASSTTDDALFELNAGTGKPHPLAAAGMSMDGPARVLSKLRIGVRFQDGSPLTAGGVAYTLNHAIDPKARHTHFARLSPLLKVAAVTAPDMMTLTLHESYAMVEHDLAMYVK